MTEPEKNPPRTLSLEARKIWTRIVADWELDYEGLIVLRVALENFDIFQRARKDLAKRGFTVGRTAGGGKANPAIAAMNTAREGFLRAWKYFGFNMEPPKEIGRPPGR